MFHKLSRLQPFLSIGYGFSWGIVDTDCAQKKHGQINVVGVAL